MSATDSLSNELFFEAHRGIVAKSPKHIDEKEEVGMHWSADKAVAREFAVDNTTPGKNNPYILHGKIPVSSVETNPEVLQEHKVGGEFSRENEIPVAYEKKVLITGRTTLRQDKNVGQMRHPSYKYPKSRKRTYNPPREATA